MSAQDKFAGIVASLKKVPGVSVGGAKKGFGASALCVKEKIFAMVSSKGGFVVKLPRDRVDALVKLGAGSRFEPARGRVMREWFVVDPKSGEDWLSLAKEALKFVGGNAK